MSASARNKEQPKFHDYLSHAQLTSMYNCAVSFTHMDLRVVYTSLHLVCEVALKKISLHYRIDVSVTSHNIGSLIFNLATIAKDPIVLPYYTELRKARRLVLYQQFPYNELRFSPIVEKPLPPLEEFANFTKDVLRRLQWVETQPH